MTKQFLTLIISAWIFMANFSSQAQIIPGALSYNEQALMFSNYNYTGTARIQGLANTQISLGGDVSSALSNPAGLGFYNRSEVTITPTVNSFNATGNYLGQNTSSTNTRFNIDNIGVVFNKTKSDYEPGKWRGGSFAISLSKINEFNGEISYFGSNPNNDILDFYVQDASNQNVDPGDLAGVTYGAFQSYLISELFDAFLENGDTVYYPFYERTFFTEFPSDDYPTDQSEIITTGGSQNQWNFSYGGNYGDFLYFGFTLGIHSIRYEITKRYSEQYPGAQGDIVNSSLLIEELLTEGIGVNGTFGLIARPINRITIGASVITPTYMSMSERYNLYTEGNFNNFSMTDYGDYFDANYDFIANPNALFTTFNEYDDLLNSITYDEESFYDYNITTPLRLNGGITYFFNKNGFISGDIEYVDYSKMKLKSNDGSLESDNSDIQQLYKSTLNYRVGGEWRFSKLRVRAGYALRGNPYNGNGIDLTTQTISGGLGFRSKKFYADLAATYKTFDTQYLPYTLDNPDNDPVFNISPVKIENVDLNFILSVGLFF
jgi:hypothetical protein